MRVCVRVCVCIVCMYTLVGGTALLLHVGRIGQKNKSNLKSILKIFTENQVERIRH